MGARVALCGPGRAREVVRSLGPREDCRDGMRERWAKVARLEVGEGGAACGWCPRDDMILIIFFHASTASVGSGPLNFSPLQWLSGPVMAPRGSDIRV